MFLQVLHLEEYECDDNRDCDVRYHSAISKYTKSLLKINQVRGHSKSYSKLS